MTITPPDIVISLILVFFTFNGFRHGFIEEMGRLISLVGGFILASKFHNIFAMIVIIITETTNTPRYATVTCRVSPSIG